jgi:hypothetical protein
MWHLNWALKLKMEALKPKPPNTYLIFNIGSLKIEFNY